jgi:hypothetical protein
MTYGRILRAGEICRAGGTKPPTLCRGPYFFFAGAFLAAFFGVLQAIEHLLYGLRYPQP